MVPRGRRLKEVCSNLIRENIYSLASFSCLEPVLKLMETDELSLVATEIFLTVSDSI